MRIRQVAVVFAGMAVVVSMSSVSPIITQTASAQAPSCTLAITSPNSATATVGLPFSFSVTTTGCPTPAIRKSGRLPKGLKFQDNHNGTASIAGTPIARMAVTYQVTLRAKNKVGNTKQHVTQVFTIAVVP